MAELLKNIFFKKAFFEKLSGQIIKEYPAFDKKKFLKLVFNSDWDKKELKQRMRHASIALHEVLSPDYRKALKILMKASEGAKGFDAMIFSDYVEVYGLEDPEASIPALELFTQLCSSEFAVRPFIIKYPGLMINQGKKWAKSKNPQVRKHICKKLHNAHRPIETKQYSNDRVLGGRSEKDDQKKTANHHIDGNWVFHSLDHF
jgi:3-methyladenine DNA glycosylase AlkC